MPTPVIRKAERQDVAYIAARFYQALRSADVPKDVVEAQGPALMDRLFEDARISAVVLHDPDNKNLLLGCALAMPPMLILVSLPSGLRPSCLDLLLSAAIGPSYDPTKVTAAALPQPSWLLCCRHIYQSPPELLTLVHFLGKTP